MKSQLRKCTQGKLNSFQKTMLQWNELHPYNAVHVVRIPQSFDISRLGKVINGTLQRLGLTRLTVDARQGIYRYYDETFDCAIQTIDGHESSRARLQTEIERQLNTRFVLDGPFCPFRFFVVPEGDSFFLGNVYFHPVADAESVVRLMKRLVESYRQNAEPNPIASLELYPARHDLLHRQSPALLARKVMAVPGLMRNMRSSCRPSFRDIHDLANRFAFFSLGAPRLGALVAAGKAWGVTLNDLFVALLLKSLAPLATRRLQATRRRKISVGCIVNLRKEPALDSPQAFGLFLGSFVITHMVPDEISLKDLAKEVGVATQRIKRARLYSGMPLELTAGRLMLHLFSTARKKKLYQKHYPLWGGLTNMNLNALWDQRHTETPVDYFRAVSTGPVTPLVLSLTTAGDVVNVGVTYRSTVFSAEEIERVKNSFLDHLKQMEK